MSGPILIGLSGKRGSGKNTVGEIIKNWAQIELGQEAQLQGFADRLKLSFARIFVPNATLEEAIAFADSMKTNGQLSFSTPLWDHDIFHRFSNSKTITGRQALQHYGTEAHRNVFWDEFWVDQLLPPDEHEWSSQWKSGINFAIITDLRFPNEAERIMELGGFVYEVRRPELDNQEDSHASEIPLPEEYIYDRFINDGTIEELVDQVHETMDYEFGDKNAPGEKQLSVF